MLVLTKSSKLPQPPRRDKKNAKGSKRWKRSRPNGSSASNRSGAGASGITTTKTDSEPFKSDQSSSKSGEIDEKPEAATNSQTRPTHSKDQRNEQPRFPKPEPRQVRPRSRTRRTSHPNLPQTVPPTARKPQGQQDRTQADSRTAPRHLLNQTTKGAREHPLPPQLTKPQQPATKHQTKPKPNQKPKGN